MELLVVKKYRACDLCRNRKRKCDGQAPCQNCLKTKSICYFSSVETLDKDSKQRSRKACDQCRSKRKKCDGELPCSGCVKSRHRDSLGNPVCNYSDITLQPLNYPPFSPQQTKIAIEAHPYYNPYDSNTLNLPNENVPDPKRSVLLQSIQGEEPHLDPHPLARKTRLIPNTDNNIEPPNIMKLADLADSEKSGLYDIEKHLLHLSSIVLNSIPLSDKFRSELLATDTVSGQSSLPLKYAMFGTALFFSNHPKLFGNTSDISQMQRIEVARKYIISSTRMLNENLERLSLPGMPNVHGVSSLQHTANESVEMDVLDIGRTMLAIGAFSYGVGEHAESIRCIKEACYTLQKLGVFSPELTGHQPEGLNVDSLVFHIPTEQMQAKKGAALSEIERKERWLLWASAFVYDTFRVMESGSEFAIDEREYPDYVGGYRAPPSNILSFPAYNSTGGKYTVWENTPHAVIFDKLSKGFKQNMYAGPSTVSFSNNVSLCVIIRRILRIIRARVPLSYSSDTQENVNNLWWEKQFGSHPPAVSETYTKLPRHISLNQLHNALLKWHHSRPLASRPFETLESFISISEPEIIHNLWGLAASSVETTFMCLAGYCYLHMHNLSQENSQNILFQLSLDNEAKYNSSEVLLSCLNCMAYMLKHMGAPYRFGMNQVGVPSPAQFNAIEALHLYIISTSGLLAARSLGYDSTEFRETVMKIQNLVIPTMDAISLIWPIADYYRYFVFD